MKIIDSKKCLMCDDGTYVDMGIASSNDLRNSGLGMNLVGSVAWRAVECNACGNVQMFRVKRTEDQMHADRW